MLWRCGSSSSAWATSAARRPPRALCAALLRERGPRGRRSRSTAPAPAAGTRAPRPTARRGRRAAARHRRSRAPRGRSPLERLRRLRPACRYGPRQRARPAGAGARRRGARQGAAAARVRPGVGRRRRSRRPGPVLRRAPTASTACSTSSRPRCRGLLDEVRPAGRVTVAGGGRRGAAARRRLAARGPSPAASSTRPGRSSSPAAGGRSSRRGPTRCPASTPTEAAGLAGWPSRRGARAARARCRPRRRPRFLALEWIRRGPPGRAGEEELGRGLAALHAAGAPAFGVLPPGAPRRPRRERPRIGSFVAERPDSATGRCSTPSGASRRWLPLARTRVTLSAAGAHAVERVCERIAELAGPAEPPARLHGDLWGGNVLAGADGRARLIDPAAYGGHREVDLAMLRLFGAPSSASSPPTTRPRRWPMGHERARGALAAVPAARARRAVRRLLRRVGRARGRALRHVTAA